MTTKTPEQLMREPDRYEDTGWRAPQNYDYSAPSFAGSVSPETDDRLQVTYVATAGSDHLSLEQLERNRAGFAEARQRLAEIATRGSDTHIA